jgi:hypothetical protein
MSETETVGGVVAEPESEADVLFAALCAERGGVAALSVTELAIARKAARALSGDADPKDVSGLLALLPPVVKREAVAAPEPTLDEVDADDREWDLSRLSDWQLELLGSIDAVARGAAEPFERRRTQAAADLVRLLDGSRDSGALPTCAAGDVEAAIHLHVHNILSPEFIPSQVFRAYQSVSAEVVAPGTEKAELLDRIAVLEQRLREAERLLSAKVQSLAAARHLIAQAEVPIMHAGLPGVERLAEMTSE